MIITQDPKIHQLDDGSIVFREDCNTGESFYKIAFVLRHGQIMPELLPEVNAKSEEHLKMLKKCKTVQEVLQTEKKFGVIRKISDLTNYQRLIVKETYVGL